jgi:hypothetical protein
LKDFKGFTQIIGRAAWLKLNAIHSCGVHLDFNHPMFYPVAGFAKMLVEVHRVRWDLWPIWGRTDKCGQRWRDAAAGSPQLGDECQRGRSAYQ